MQEMVTGVHDVLVIGDVHGYYQKLLGLLQDKGLVDAEQRWSGGTKMLWFLGDFFDRGPHGIAVLELVMRLQEEARTVGGSVQSLLGNHEVLILAAQRLGKHLCLGPGGTFLSAWKRNGGQKSDLAGLTPEHIEWISRLPAMARVGTWLFVHADSTLYRKYGSSVEEVNRTLQTILQSNNAEAWDNLLEDFARRREFENGPHGEERLEAFLHTFGGRRLLHGHTPIEGNARKARSVVQARVYAQGRCVNVDGGMFTGGPGFIYSLPPDTEGDER